MFQYMLLLRGATTRFVDCKDVECVSIHAPLARSNDCGRPGGTVAGRFNTCSSCEEQPFNWAGTNASADEFQYMLLLRGATPAPNSASPSPMFQYMLLLRGATRGVTCPLSDVSFQYMLLLRGATFPLRLLLRFLLQFQYMLLLRGAT